MLRIKKILSYNMEPVGRLIRFSLLTVSLLFLLFILAGCDLIQDFLEYNPGANLTFTGVNNTDGSVSISNVEVSVSGSGDSWKENSSFSITGKIYSSFTGLEGGEYSIGVDVYDGTTLLGREGTTIYLPSGESLEIEYSLELIDSQIQVFFQSVTGVSGDDATSLEIYSAGMGFYFHRNGWNGIAGEGEALYAAEGDFYEAASILITYPDGNVVGMDRSRDLFDSSIYLDENQFLQAGRMDYGESGLYTLLIEDFSGQSVTDNEFPNLTWGSDQVADFSGDPPDFFLTTPPNSYSWNIASSDGIGSLIVMVINKDNTESYGSVNWSTYPGGSGSFLMDSGSLQTGEAWIVLITLDAELTDLSILDSLDDFHPDVLAAEFLLSDTVEIDGIGIAQEDITVNN